jgi:hypothetical protein
MLLRILDRLRPLINLWVLPLWGFLLWSWSVLAEVHLAEFVFRFGGEMRDIVHLHPYWILIVSVGFILAVAAWPEIKHLAPDLPLPIHQRVHEIEKRVMASLKIQNELNDGYRESHINLTGKIATLETNGVTANKERSGLGVQITNLERGIYQNGNRLDRLERIVNQHRPWIGDLQRSITGLVQESPQLAVFIVEASILMHEANILINDLTHIKELHPDSPIAKLPFSKPWWRSDTNSEPFATEWACLINDHVARCYAFAVNFNTKQDDIIDELLKTYCNWNSTVSMTDSIGRLASHLAKLRTLRVDYVAKFFDRAAVSVTIS